MNHPPESQLGRFKRPEAKPQPGPRMHSAGAPELGWPFSQRSEPARCGRAGHHVGGKLSHSCPCPQAPPLPGGCRLVQGWQQMRTIILSCVWSPRLCVRSPHPHGLAHCSLGRAAVMLLGFPRDADLLPEVTPMAWLPFLPGHILKRHCPSCSAHRSRGPGGAPSLAVAHPLWQFVDLALHGDGGPECAHGVLHLAGLQHAAPFLAQSL